MLVVDSGVWIDFFRGSATAAVEALAQQLDAGEVRIVMPDLVLYEVLRGFRQERDLRQARRLLAALDVENCGGQAQALAAVNHYRALRLAGFTPRSGIDMLVGSLCIEKDYVLLHQDRDFDAMEAVCGLRVWGRR